jgi:hypothetical protein
VAVTLLVAGVNAVDLDADLDARLARVGAVDDSSSVEVVERAADLGDHRMPSDEADAGVAGVEGVRAGQGGEVGDGGGHESSFGSTVD